MGGWVWLEMGELSYYTEVFLEISHDAAQEKILDVFKETMRDDWYCNSFDSVDTYNSCINYSCKYQKLCSIL